MFRHVGIVVRDLEKQIKFYKEFFDLEIYYLSEETGEFIDNLIGTKNINIKICKLGRNNKTIIELLKFKDDNFVDTRASLNRPGYTHVAFDVEDLDKLYKKMLNYDINFISPPTIDVSQKHKVCFCLDYEENFIELVETLGVK